MALARSMGLSFMNPNSSGIGGALGPVLAILAANRPYLDEYKAAGGDTRAGVSATLRNGVQGHFTGEFDPNSGEPVFQIDYTPPAFSQAVQADYAASHPTGPSFTPTNTAPFINLPKPIAVPGPVYTPPGSSPPLATTAAPAPGVLMRPGPLGLPVVVWAGVGGLVLFLIARRF